MAEKINHIDYLLRRWGKYQIRQASGGLGYAKMSILMGAGNHGDNGYFDPAPPKDITEEDFDEITKAINSLKLVIRICILYVYKDGLDKSERANAEALGVSPRTLSQYLGCAHGVIAEKIARRL